MSVTGVAGRDRARLRLQREDTDLEVRRAQPEVVPHLHPGQRDLVAARPEGEVADATRPGDRGDDEAVERAATPSAFAASAALSRTGPQSW